MKKSLIALATATTLAAFVFAPASFAAIDANNATKAEKAEKQDGNKKPMMHHHNKKHHGKHHRKHHGKHHGAEKSDDMTAQ